MTSPFGQVLQDPELHRSVRIIFSQAVNDLIGLRQDIHDRSGRSAIRTARSLVEHAINLRSVVTDADAEERHLTHLDVALELMGRLEIGADLLGKKQRSAYLHSMRKASRGAPTRLRAARDRYGRGFERSWSRENLYDRAQRFSMEDHYDFHRLAPLVTLGSAGGVLGTVREQEGYETYRTGQALELCPVALPGGGVSAYVATLDAIAIALPALDIEQFQRGLGVAALWPEYFEGPKEIDRRWPRPPDV